MTKPYDRAAYDRMRADPERRQRRIDMKREATRRRADEIRSPWKTEPARTAQVPEIASIALPWVTKARLMAGK